MKNVGLSKEMGLVYYNFIIFINRSFGSVFIGFFEFMNRKPN